MSTIRLLVACLIAWTPASLAITIFLTLIWPADVGDCGDCLSFLTPAYRSQLLAGPLVIAPLIWLSTRPGAGPRSRSTSLRGAVAAIPIVGTVAAYLIEPQLWTRTLDHGIGASEWWAAVPIAVGLGVLAIDVISGRR